MPIYEYECKTCGNKIEALQKVSDPPLETCDCGDQGQLRKLVSAPAFQFKGDGWYVTDYARKDKKGGADKKNGADSGQKAEGSGTEKKEAKDSGKARADSTASKSTSASSAPSGGSAGA